MRTGSAASLRWFFYCSYALVLTAVLLYVRFPAQEFKEYCTRKAEGLFNGTKCTIGKITYAFPFNLRFDTVKFSLPNGENTPLFELNSLKLSSRWRDFGGTFVVSGQGYAGHFDGVLQTGQGNNDFSLDPLTIRNVDLSAIQPVHDTLQRKISGRLDYTGTYSAVVNQYLEGKAVGKVKLREGGIALMQPVLAMKEIDLQQVEMHIQYDKRRLQITKGKANGNEMTADFTGMVQMITPWYLSNVSAKGDFALQAAYMRENITVRNELIFLQKQFKKTTIPFQIAGNLQTPAFQFGY
ncbi:type II secretion system protein GspN [Desulfoprunum benzoelyticum]|uniref:Type II secretion system protein N n=1 Tax=Desulfoprunum benzoelyticum TaxID=1506996 RepID=A0A840V2H7_9BACT|nr:type II secretion system protein GspN [Desulfoprunum benzoelyticum]MBB5347351.1 type II secretion system protein N [Desulfoprunum benzoelyticum]MBM9530765.1 type II secretion system protein GspN [Desulfoprunum benzoelyticum]